MFSVVQDVLKTFTRNDKQLGGTAGFTAILHTHARNLDFHPHIHVVIPAASINLKTCSGEPSLPIISSATRLLPRSSGQSFYRPLMTRKPLQPHRAVHKSGLLTAKTSVVVTRPSSILADICIEALSVNRIFSTVPIPWSPTDTSMPKQVSTGQNSCRRAVSSTVDVACAAQGLSQSTDYGFLHPCSKRLIMLVQLALRVPGYKLLPTLKKRPPISCPRCGAPMKIIMTMLPQPPPENTLCLA
jgi:hypothetical protein